MSPVDLAPVFRCRLLFVRLSRGKMKRRPAIFPRSNKISRNRLQHPRIKAEREFADVTAPPRIGVEESYSASSSRCLVASNDFSFVKFEPDAVESGPALINAWRVVKGDVAVEPNLSLDKLNTYFAIGNYLRSPPADDG